VVVQRLRGKGEHRNHGSAAVLQLSRLQLEEFVRVGVAREAEGVEGSTRVLALLKVRLSVARKLNVADRQHLDHRKRIRVERQFESSVLRLRVLDGSSLHPVDASDGLSHNGSSHAKHGPAAVDELALAEALDAEHLVVRRERASLHLSLGRRDASDHTSRLVHSLVLVEIIEADEQVFCLLRETEGVESRITGQRAVKVRGRDQAGQPHGAVDVGRLLRDALGGAGGDVACLAD